MMNKISAFVIVLFIFILCFFLIKSSNHDNTNNKSGYVNINMSCVAVEKHRIRGSSLEPVFRDGQTVVLLRGYYVCNSPKRGDIVAIKFRTRNEIFVKKLVGLPGDRVRFEGNHLILNGGVLKNSLNEPYLFSDRAIKILSIPLEDGKIPPNNFMVLGEEVSEEKSFDSRSFGYITKEQMVGRVLSLKEWEDLIKTSND